MTDQFVDANKMVPITPPPELVEEWANASARTHRENGTYAQHEFALATQAARWGADMELEACCDSLQELWAPSDWITGLRAKRRPKPPSLKEQALAALDEEQAEMSIVNYKMIRAVLESLPD